MRVAVNAWPHYNSVDINVHIAFMKQFIAIIYLGLCLFSLVKQSLLERP